MPHTIYILYTAVCMRTPLELRHVERAVYIISNDGASLGTFLLMSSAIHYRRTGRKYGLSGNQTLFGPWLYLRHVYFTITMLQVRAG